VYRHRSPRPTGAFTLIELLIVVAIIGTLIALAMPACAWGLAVAREATCLTHLRSLGTAVKLYASDSRGFYPPAWSGASVRWMDQLKPYLSKGSDVYRCPSDDQGVPLPWDPQITMSYGMNCFNFKDNRHCFWYGTAVIAVKRPGQTVLLADCTPGTYYVGGGKQFAEPVKGVDYRHTGGSFNVLFCDGSAGNLTEATQEDWDASQ
jgi:prepilin-type N-terminal cleavage/methylation domain-containing protein/prepilin-type processing-associated H-X9-DG protein